MLDRKEILKMIKEYIKKSDGKKYYMVYIYILEKMRLLERTGILLDEALKLEKKLCFVKQKLKLK